VTSTNTSMAEWVKMVSTASTVTRMSAAFLAGAAILGTWIMSTPFMARFCWKWVNLAQSA
jgi:hypothetical protein